jgi:transketolase
MYAQHLKLSNLVCIVDNNNSQTRAVPSLNLKNKFESFGWQSREIDGHNIAAIEQALFSEDIPLSATKPLVVIANTVKGKGIKVMEEDHFAWHHRAPTEAEFALFKEELLR